MKTITAFGVGTVVGAAIAILFAPKSGEETLADLTNIANGGIERGTAKAREITRQTTVAAAKLKDQVEGVRGAVEAGVRAFKDARKQGTS
jgi:gas vesicle protein